MTYFMTAKYKGNHPEYHQKVHDIVVTVAFFGHKVRVHKPHGYEGKTYKEEEITYNSFVDFLKEWQINKVRQDMGDGR